jgi:hypothetical protein
VNREHCDRNDFSGCGRAAPSVALAHARKAPGRKYAPDRPDDGDFTDTGSTDRHLGRQRESDCRDLAFGNGKTDVLLNQRHSLVRINRTVCPLRPL